MATDALLPDRTLEPVGTPSWRAPALDGLRALAAFAVLLVHVGFQTGAGLHDDLWSRIVSRGDVGVAVFFCLSGVVVGRPFVVAVLRAAPLPPLLRYVRRRAVRILPAYWLVLLVAGLTVARDDDRSWGTRLLDVLVLPQFAASGPGTGLSATWSLTPEVCFYLLLPGLAWVLARCRPGSTVARRAARVLAVAAGALVVSVMWQAVTFGSGGSRFGFWPPGVAAWFGVGLALATLSAWADLDARPRALLLAWARNPGPSWLVGAAAVVLAATPLGGPATVLPPPTAAEGVTRGVLFTLAAAAFVGPLVVRRAAPVVRALGDRVGHRLGELSYGVFLWHLPLLTAWYDLTGTPEFTGSFWLTTLGLTAASLVAAELTRRLVEDPVRSRFL